MPKYKPRLTVHYLKEMAGKECLTAVEKIKIELRVQQCGEWNDCSRCRLKRACVSYYDKLD